MSKIEANAKSSLEAFNFIMQYADLNKTIVLRGSDNGFSFYRRFKKRESVLKFLDLVLGLETNKESFFVLDAEGQNVFYLAV